MEYLAIVGISFLFLMPMVVIFFERTGSLQEDINLAQIEKIGLELIGSAEEVYYLGVPSQKKLEIYFPEQIDTVTIENQSILLKIKTLEYEFPAESTLPLNLTGNINARPGLHLITLTATSTGVTISETT